MPIIPMYFNMNRKEKSRKRALEWYHNNTDRQRDRLYRKKYKITLEEVKGKWLSQNGCCAICGNKFKDRKDMHVDHNHITEKVRQLLCNNCNTAIGLMEENVTTLLRAVDYLNKWK